MNPVERDSENDGCPRVWVWVPSRGNVLVNEFFELADAFAFACFLEPLEVRVTCGERVWRGGRYCDVSLDVGHPTRTIPAKPTCGAVRDNTAPAEEPEPTPF